MTVTRSVTRSATRSATYGATVGKWGGEPAWMRQFETAFDFVNGVYRLNNARVPWTVIDGYHTRTSGRRAEFIGGRSQEYANGVMALTDRGYDSREGWTNLIPNPLGAGVVVGVVGSGGALPTGWYVNTGHGLTTQVVGVSTVNGLPVIRFRVSGTSNGGFYELGLQPLGSSSPAILPSTAYNVSGYMGAVAGAFPAGSELGFTQRRADQSQSVSVALASTVTLNATPVLTRFGVTLTTAADAAFGRMRITMLPANGATVEVTFDIAAPQLNQAAYQMPFGVGTVAPDALVIPAADAGLAVDPSATGLTMVWRGRDFESAASVARFAEVWQDANNRASFSRALSGGAVSVDAVSSGTASTLSATLAQVPRGVDTTIMQVWRSDGTIWRKIGLNTASTATRSPMTSISGFGLANNGDDGTARLNAQTRIAAFGAFAPSDADALALFNQVAGS